MPRITISYRRDDSLDITGRIFDRLAEHFGREAVFRDIDNIPPGADFRRHIHRVLDESDIVLAIVGPRWIGDEYPRLASPGDPVRIEIETALRKDKPLIPVLVSRAVMPHPDALPDSIHDFAYRNALQVDSGQDFEVHVGRLIRAMERILPIDEERAADQAVQGHAAVKQAALRIKPKLVDPIGLGLVLMLGVIGFGSWWLFVEQPAEMARLGEEPARQAAAKAQQEEQAARQAAAAAQQQRKIPPGLLGVWDGTTLVPSTGVTWKTRFIFLEDGTFKMSTRGQDNYGWDMTGRYERSGDLYSLIWANDTITSHYRLDLGNGSLSMQCLDDCRMHPPPILVLYWQGRSCTGDFFHCG